MIRFTKMQGCGNDYVYINNDEEHIDDMPLFTRKVLALMVVYLYIKMKRKSQILALEFLTLMVVKQICVEMELDV